MKNSAFEYDAFICHASEDKAPFVRPLAHALTALGLKVFYDEFSLKLGDSLSASIDRGLGSSRYGIVIVSRNFMSKAWPQRELQGLVAREIEGRAAILPVWHDVERDEVAEFSAPLADKLAAKTSDGTAEQIALQIVSIVRPDIMGAKPVDVDAVKELQNAMDAIYNTGLEQRAQFMHDRMMIGIDDIIRANAKKGRVFTNEQVDILKDIAFQIMYISNDRLHNKRGILDVIKDKLGIGR
jgi:hypothetical protein